MVSKRALGAHIDDRRRRAEHPLRQDVAVWSTIRAGSAPYSWRQVLGESSIAALLCLATAFNLASSFVEKLLMLFASEAISL